MAVRVLLQAHTAGSADPNAANIGLSLQQMSTLQCRKNRPSIAAKVGL
jgi:hypothetical protein